jgi:HK97 family phage prohead protease
MSKGKGITSDVEYRATPSPVELRSGGGSRRIGGYAAVFGHTSNDLGGFREIVEPSAFNMSRGTNYANVVCRVDHSDIIGSTRGGTLELTIDRTGLDYSCSVAETRSGDDVIALVSRNDYGGSSFAFTAIGPEADEWRHNGSVLVRHLLSVKLIDVSPCGIPAYEAATVSLRSLAAQVDAPLDDVLELARAGQLPKLLSRSDIDGGQPKSVTPQQRQIEAMRPKSGRQALLETMALRWPAPPQQTRLRQQLTDMRYPPYQTAESVGLKTLEG